MAFPKYLNARLFYLTCIANNFSANSFVCPSLSLSSFSDVSYFLCVSVYVMIAESFEFEGLMEALKVRGLLDTGQYIVLGVDAKQYDSKDPVKYIAGQSHV